MQILSVTVKIELNICCQYLRLCLISIVIYSSLRNLIRMVPLNILIKLAFIKLKMRTDNNIEYAFMGPYQWFNTNWLFAVCKSHIRSWMVRWFLNRTRDSAKQFREKLKYFIVVYIAIWIKRLVRSLSDDVPQVRSRHPFTYS